MIFSRSAQGQDRSSLSSLNNNYKKSYDFMHMLISINQKDN